MFWKTYRHYIKQEIQRMRTASTNSFKTLFIKGKKSVQKHNEDKILILINVSHKHCIRI